MLARCLILERFVSIKIRAAAEGPWIPLLCRWDFCYFKPVNAAQITSGTLSFTFT
jgi:hypothetical protein